MSRHTVEESAVHDLTLDRQHGEEEKMTITVVPATRRGFVSCVKEQR